MPEQYFIVMCTFPLIVIACDAETLAWERAETETMQDGERWYVAKVIGHVKRLSGAERELYGPKGEGT